MQLKLSDRSRVEREIAGALKNAINSHGAITLSNRCSAAKRVYYALKNLAERGDSNERQARWMQDVSSSDAALQRGYFTEEVYLWETDTSLR